MPSLSPSLILNVKITISPPSIPLFFDYFRTCFAHVVKEPELVYFVVGQNPAVPGEVWWTEGWNCTEEWLREVQLKREYYGPYLEGTEGMFLKDSKLFL